jgi:hypothetical protein
MYIFFGICYESAQVDLFTVLLHLIFYFKNLDSGSIFTHKRNQESSFGSCSSKIEIQVVIFQVPKIRSHSDSVFTKGTGTGSCNPPNLNRSNTGPYINSAWSGSQNSPNTTAK